MDFIDLATQQKKIRSRLDERMRRVLDHGQYIMGPEVAELEQKLAEYVGIKHCVGVANGTDAIQIALMALGIGAGDEVITTSFTFAANAEMILMVGATPVFVDIDPATYNLDPRKIEAAITPRTKAIMPVSLYGQCADFSSITPIAKKHGIPVIEDAAQSFGAKHQGKRSCSMTLVSTASFFPSKTLGCYGDGGACFTYDDGLAARMRSIRTHGQEKRYYHRILGMNSRLDTLQAAILLAKLEVLESEVESRGKIGARYSAELAKIKGVVVPAIAPGNTHVYAQYTIQVDERDVVSKRLNEQGVPTAVHYPLAAHMQPAFRSDRFPVGSLPVSEAAAQRVLSLPMHPYLGETDQDQVIKMVRKAVS